MSKEQVTNIEKITICPDIPEDVATGIRTSLAENAKDVGLQLIHASAMLPGRTFKQMVKFDLDMKFRDADQLMNIARLIAQAPDAKYLNMSVLKMLSFPGTPDHVVDRAIEAAFESGVPRNGLNRVSATRILRQSS